MKDYTFEWKDDKGNNCRMDCFTSDECQAWVWAFRKCGWNNRTSLGLIGNCSVRQIRDGVIKNWWEAMKDRNLYKFHTLYLSWNMTDKLRSGFMKISEC